MTHLSDETAWSFTEEAQGSGSLSSSGGWQPGPQAPGSGLETEKQTPSVGERNKQSKLSDLKNDEEKLTEKWINYLRGKETNSGRHQQETKLQTDITRVSDEELKALQAFCATKVNLIHHRVDSKRKSSRHKKLQLKQVAEASEIDALNCTVPDELLNRIYFENVRTTLEQAAAAKQHIFSHCPNCNRKRGELAQSAFLKQKKTLLESLLLQEKIDERLHTTDFLTRVAEAHQDLPRLSDDPRMIWKRLNEKTQIGYSGFERSDTRQKM